MGESDAAARITRGRDGVILSIVPHLPEHPMPHLDRRGALAALAAGLLPQPAKPFQLAPFSAEVTVPIGHALMGGGIAPARWVEDPLWAHGFVLLGPDQPIVLACVDWCEIRNDAYTSCREA